MTLPEWPTFGLVDDVRPAMRDAMRRGQPLALATLHTLEGGAPRSPGTQMLFSDGVVAGFMSGGCVEGDVALHAARTLQDGEPRRLVYGHGSPWPDIRLPCGARIEILVERAAPDDPALLGVLAASAARRAAVLVTDGRRRRVEPASDVTQQCAAAAIPFELRRLYEPVQRLAVIGGDPTALALASLGSQMGFETILVRPNGPATAPPLPGLAYSREAPDAALTMLHPDRWTAIVVATHDWDTDERAIRAALRSDAGYVGLLGSARRLPERLARLRSAGAEPEALDRLYAPVGLDTGGKAPWEVAVSVTAQIVKSRNVQLLKGPKGSTIKAAAR
jgi:xanthine dehydrogenase accessory factor